MRPEVRPIDKPILAGLSRQRGDFGQGQRQQHRRSIDTWMVPLRSQQFGTKHSLVVAHMPWMHLHQQRVAAVVKVGQRVGRMEQSGEHASGLTALGVDGQTRKLAHLGASGAQGRNLGSKESVTVQAIRAVERHRERAQKSLRILGC